MTKKEMWERFQQENAEKYSSWNPIYVIGWKQLYAASVKYLKSIFGKRDIKALDLGGGTGYFAKWILRELEGAYVVVSDFSENMLSAVAGTLCEFDGRYEKSLLDFQEDEIGEEEYDLVVSSMAIHHLRDINEYRSLYSEIYAALKDEGLFLCIDILKGADSDIEDHYQNVWLNHLTGCFGPNEANRIIEQVKREDSPISIHDHLRLLLGCGFSSCDCIMKHNNFGSYTGKK